MDTRDEEEQLLRSVALQNASSILAARRRAEAALMHANAALARKTSELAHTVSVLRATLESTTDGIVVTDGAVTVTGCNERFLTMWGISRDVIDSGDRALLMKACARQFQDPQAFVARITEISAKAMRESYDVLEFADGRVVERFSRILYVDGDQTGRVWSFRDITERRLADEAIRQSGDRFRFMAESMPQKIFTATPAGELDFLNRQWQEFTGLSFARIREGGWAQVLHPEDVPQSLELWGQALATGTPLEMEHRFLRRDGSFAWHLTRAHAMRDSEGNVVMWIGSNTDIDHLKQAADERKEILQREQSARAEAERANAMKDEFLATLSHELRTPISAILGWSQVLRLRPMDKAELDQGLATIERNARIQTQLIEDLLDMSRITSGKVRLDIQPVEAIACIEAAIETVRPAAEAKGIRLEKFLDASASPMVADPSRLQQIVWNLLSNAIKFTPGGGEVRVRLAQVNGGVEITVEDTGIGIPPGFLPQVFERFRQADATTTRAFAGLGLGLAIVKHLVELHGGQVRVTSAGENLGTTFTVHLPRSTVASDVPAPARRPAREYEGTAAGLGFWDLSGVSVLVVDDEADGRNLARRVLEDCNATVLTASGASEALALIESARPQVLVSDIGMPGVDGYELLRRVRLLGAERGGRIPAIALTAFARSEDRTRALRAGFLVHVAKPVEPSELIATVASVAGRTGPASS